LRHFINFTLTFLLRQHPRTYSPRTHMGPASDSLSELEYSDHQVLQMKSCAMSSTCDNHTEIKVMINILFPTSTPELINDNFPFSARFSFVTCSGRQPLGISSTDFWNQMRQPTNSVKALRETQSTDSDHRNSLSGFILLSTTAGLLMVGCYSLNVSSQMPVCPKKRSFGDY